MNKATIEFLGWGGVASALLLSCEVNMLTLTLCALIAARMWWLTSGPLV